MITAILCTTLIKMKGHELAPLFIILIIIGMVVDALIADTVISAIK